MEKWCWYIFYIYMYVYNYTYVYISMYFDIFVHTVYIYPYTVYIFDLFPGPSLGQSQSRGDVDSIHHSTAAWQLQHDSHSSNMITTTATWQPRQQHDSHGSNKTVTVVTWHPRMQHDRRQQLYESLTHFVSCRTTATEVKPINHSTAKWRKGRRQHSSWFYLW